MQSRASRLVPHSQDYGIGTLPEEDFGRFQPSRAGCIIKCMQGASLPLSSVISSKDLSRNITELLAMRKTDAGERRKALQSEARELEREARTLESIPQMQPAARIRQDEAERLKAEAEALKRAVRLEDCHVYVEEKVKGSKTYHYWMVSWWEGDRARNVHLGSCRKMSQAEALQKARTIKAEMLVSSGLYKHSYKSQIKALGT